MALRDPSVTHLLFADGDIEFKPSERAPLGNHRAIFEADFARTLADSRVRPLASAADVERLLAFDADVASVPALLHRFKPEYEDVMEVGSSPQSCHALPAGGWVPRF